jgi:hypothetical protein
LFKELAATGRNSVDEQEFIRESKEKRIKELLK